MVAVEKRLSLSDIIEIDVPIKNPNAEEAEAISKRICKDAGIHLATFDSYNTMSAFLYPEASVERLVGIIVIMNFLYYVDDVYERHARDGHDHQQEGYLHEVFEQCAKIMLTGQMPDHLHPLYESCLATHKIIMPLTRPEWLGAFIFKTLQHLKSTTDGVYDIEDDVDNIVNNYIQLRSFDSGMYPAIHLIEFANNLYLPEEVANHPFVKKMEDAVANIGGLMNDIFSYEKEVIQFNSAFNLIAVFERYEKLSFTDALHESIKVVNDNIQTFLDGEANPHDFGDERLNKMVCDYVRHLRYQINATWHWQKDTDRYYSTTSPLPELRLPTEEVLVEEVPAEEVPVEAVLVEEVLVEAVPVEAVLVEEVLLKAAPVEAVLVEEVLVEDVLIEEVSVVETIDIVDETAVVDFVVQPTIASSGIKSNSKPVMAFPIVI